MSVPQKKSGPIWSRSILTPCMAMHPLLSAGLVALKVVSQWIKSTRRR